MAGREVFFLIGRGGALLFCDASTSPSALPDSRKRWEAIWRHRDELEELAHSHPNGPAAFSEEDKTTMAALESALGKQLRFSVVTPDKLITQLGDQLETEDEEPWWVELMRLASGIPSKPSSSTSQPTPTGEA